MKIHLPQALNELGNRQNNEDAVFPPKDSAVSEDRLFLVCDGVGGQEKGEVASALICKHFHQYIKIKEKTAENNTLLSEALRGVEEKMRSYIQQHPASSGMASTLTCALLRPEKIILGWVGDSRIYHIRDGQVLFKTKDHSQVQWLIDNGEITETQAARHPQKNVILRAINGSKPAKMDQHVIENIQTGDFLFLCTDGILETIDESEINRLFRSSHGPEQIKQAIYTHASGRTQDNFSMYLIKIKEVQVNETTAPIKSETEQPAILEKESPLDLVKDPPKNVSVNEEAGKRNLNWIIPVVFFLVIVTLALSYFWPKSHKSETTEPKQEIEKVEPLSDQPQSSDDKPDQDR